jgi:hypothetical protein
MEQEAQASDDYAANEAYDSGIDRMMPIREAEPDMQRLSLEDYEELCNLRRAFLKKATELKVSFNQGAVHGNVMCHCLDSESDKEIHAGETECLDATITELWHLQDVQLWAVDMDNPSFKEALKGPDRIRWLEAYEKGLASLQEHDKYELVERPQRGNVMKGKVICKIKRDSLGHVERYKCRYVGCGYSQQEGVDYIEHQVWAPTGQHATLRVLLVHAVQNMLSIRHIDISTAFLHGALNENVYVEQPQVMNDCSDRVWRLKKSLYGLKQAGRQWHLKLSELLKRIGFVRAGYDPALFCATSTSGEKQFIFLWVDGLIVVASTRACDAIVEQVLKAFKGRDLGEASWVLGMSITRDKAAKTIELSQERMMKTALNVLECRSRKASGYPWMRT